MGGFASAVHTKKLLKLCAEHSHVIPAESYTALTDPDERLRTIVQLQQKAQALEAELAQRRHLEEALRRAYAELEGRVAERTAALHCEMAERQRLEGAACRPFRAPGASGRGCLPRNP